MKKVTVKVREGKEFKLEDVDSIHEGDHVMRFMTARDEELIISRYDISYIHVEEQDDDEFEVQSVWDAAKQSRSEKEVEFEPDTPEPKSEFIRTQFR